MKDDLLLNLTIPHHKICTSIIQVITLMGTTNMAAMRNCDREQASIFARLLGEMRYLVYTRYLWSRPASQTPSFSATKGLRCNNTSVDRGQGGITLVVSPSERLERSCASPPASRYSD